MFARFNHVGRGGGGAAHMHVLLIENNNIDRQESLHTSLQEQGHHVWLVHTPESATNKTASLWPNLVVLNPARGQLDVAVFQEAISKTKLDIPHIVVHGKAQLDHDLGSDTILITSDKPQQLSQCIHKATAKQRNRFLRFPDLIIDCKHHNILRDRKISSLTPKEFKLLHLLIKNRDQVLTRKKIMQKVWETDYMGDTRTLDVHIRWLREKIEKNPSRPQMLITIRGVGYRFIAEVEID
jgi:DNA-binding response OmpR family regulator